MDIWSWLKEVTLLIVVYEISCSESDILESFRPSADNPPELNDFLRNVLEHKDDFTFARKAAGRYQKTTIAVRDLDELEETSLDPFDKLKLNDKRNVHHLTRFRNIGKWQSNKRPSTHKFRRYLPRSRILNKKRLGKSHVHKPKGKMKPKHHLPSQIYNQAMPEAVAKRFLSKVEIEPEGESGRVDLEYDEGLLRVKKEAPGVHRTYKNPKKIHTQVKTNKQSEYYYVDLQDQAEKTRDRESERKRHDLKQIRPNRFLFAPSQPKGRNDYYQDERELHHTMNDEVAFERAQSFELEPKLQQGQNNNPEGNSLYSVDAGRPDNIQPINQQTTGQQACKQNHLNNQVSVKPHECNHKKQQKPCKQSESYFEQEDRLDNEDQSIKQQEPLRQAGEEQTMNQQAENEYAFLPQGEDATTSEGFLIFSNNHLVKIESTTPETNLYASKSAPAVSTEEEKHETKIVKQLGNGFIEITKMVPGDGDLQKKSAVETLGDDATIDVDDDDVKNKEQVRLKSSIFAKNSFHPLRVKNIQQQDLEYYNDGVQELPNSDERYRGRKLQFLDDDMANFYNQDQDQAYETIPSRGRRDFLDVFGMKNEEDYSEDNSYKESLNVNNTDVRNDTHIRNMTSTTEKCTAKITTHQTTTKRTTVCQQQEDFKDKSRLEELNEVSDGTTVGDFKETTEKGRNVKRFSKFEDYLEEQHDNSDEIEGKILLNKERIFNAHELSDNNKPHRPVEGKSVFKGHKIPVYVLPKNNVKKSIEDCEETTLCDFDTEETTCEPTLLPIVESFTEPEITDINNFTSIRIENADQTAEEDDAMSDVVNGKLASKIVCTVFDEVKKNTALTKIVPGLSRKHDSYTGNVEFDALKSCDSEDPNETRQLVDQIANVVNKLVLDQIHKKNCQLLPSELQEFLNSLLDVKSTTDRCDFVPNAQQSDFIFNSKERAEETTPQAEFARRKLEETLVELERLLSDYKNLNEECQSKAAPVKNYIEEHVKILKDVVNCPTHPCGVESKRNTPQIHQALVEKQLESLGLGKQHGFVPNFDLNKLVKSKLKNHRWKYNMKRDVDNNQKSPQYKKLQLAARKLREKRENEKKIAEFFANQKKKRSVKKAEIDYEEPVVYSLG